MRLSLADSYEPGNPWAVAVPVPLGTLGSPFDSMPWWPQIPPDLSQLLRAPGEK